MAACGASDSVIMHTSISGELQVPLLLFSVSLHGVGGGWGWVWARGWVRLNRLMLLFSAQYHTLCITSVTGGLRRSGHWSKSQHNENGKKWKKRSSVDSLFPFQQRAPIHGINLQNRRERTFHIHPSCTHIYTYTHIYISHIYIYLHTLLFCSERGKTILQNMYLWWPDCNCSFFLSLPFMMSAKHSGL